MKPDARAAALALVLSCALPAGAAPEQTFTEITPGDPSLEPSNLMALVERGDVRAMNNIGLLWARGLAGAQRNLGEARHWWTEAAKRGYPVAMNNLGLLYAGGEAGAPDYGQAMVWWKRAAEAGSAWAMNSIGDLYETGSGVPKDYAQALDWYRRAAEGGDGLGMYNMGHLHDEGMGVQRDYQAAFHWYSEAADRGVGSAMRGLGRLLAEGRGYPADTVEAHAWHAMAAAHFGPEDAQEARANATELGQLAAALDPAQRARAEEIRRNLEARVGERMKALAPAEPETGGSRI